MKKRYVLIAAAILLLGSHPVAAQQCEGFTNAIDELEQKIGLDTSQQQTVETPEPALQTRMITPAPRAMDTRTRKRRLKHASPSLRGGMQDRRGNPE